ncbi:MAG TPA: hypothetical protein VNO33_00040 [Kofleriaceae bacterium]|nr:hypothetical protein [Kofleriaceae bacterium]
MGGARAEPEPRPLDLSVRQLPVLSPTSLAMRHRVHSPRARAPDRPPPLRLASLAPTGATTLPAAGVRPARPDASRELALPGRRLDEKVVFRFNLGFGIDGGQASDQPLISGDELLAQDYAPLRSYGFGDLVLGTRGLLFSSLGTYFASEFRFDQDIGQPTQAVPSVHYEDDIENVLVRSGYAEAQGFFSRPWLRPLYFRAGRQFKYGVAVAHFDGLTLGYDTRPVTASVWFGSRVSLYGLGQDPTGPQAEFFGASARVDLYELRRIPLVLTTDTLNFGGFNHREYGLAYRWKPDILIRGSARQLDSEFARQTLSVWARLSEVTTLTAEVDNRSSDDWIYDLIVFRKPERAADPRNYLNLGPALPRVQIDVRAGTVILRNLDVLLRAAAALEHAGEEEDAPFSPTYLEAGAALEVRLRRSFRVGSSFIARRYRRDALEPIGDAEMLPDPLAEIGTQIGERSFYEGGLGVDYSVGARRFSAAGELYGRLYDSQSPYQSPVDDEVDLRTGGRFSVEGWAFNRLRIKAEYDVSISDIQLAPELRGIKSLRVLAEGTY